LLFATLSGVKGFTVSPSSAVAHQVSRPLVAGLRIATTSLQSEVEEASEETTTAESSVFDKTIYIGNVSFDAIEEDIRDAFSSIGEVAKVDVPLSRETGKCRGFAFVAMTNSDDHEAAIEQLNTSEIAGRTVYVSESLPKDQVAEKKKKFQGRKKRDQGAKIYVGNLNFDTTAEDLKAAFEEFGDVMDCFLPVDYDGNARGFGFIQMSDEDSLKAIEGMNGVEFDGRTLNVNKSLPKGERPAAAAPKETKLYVGNLSWGTEEGSPRELFGEYGSVIDCYIPTDRETGQHRGFAFVTMGPDDALRAADETDGYELDGRILRVNEAQPKGQRNNYNSYNDGGNYDGDDAWDSSEDDSWGNDSY